MSVNAVNSDGSLLRVAGGTLYADAPIGTISPFGGSAVPSGYLLCNGQAVSRTSYKELFASIGVAFGSGDGSTTFNLPDMRESVPVGSGTRGSGVADHDIYTVGQFKDDQLQDHRHTSTPFANVENGDYSTAFTNDAPKGQGGTVTVGRHGTTTHGKQLGVNYIIKAKQVAVPADFVDAIDNAVADALSDFAKPITLVPVNNSTINYDKSRVVEGIVTVCADIVVQSGSHLVKENAIANVPNYGTASIGYILPCLYRNTANGTEEPGFAIIQTDGNIYSYYTKTDYNQMRINTSYSSKI